MKPTPQISSERRENFPFTDYHYQSTFDASRTAAKETRSAHRRHGFWRLGADFHGAEAVYGDTVDFLVFTLMGITCTLPIFAIGMTIIHVFLGY
jgi:hypothetical protein